jgi:hypothetical protein
MCSAKTIKIKTIDMLIPNTSGTSRSREPWSKETRDWPMHKFWCTMICTEVQLIRCSKISSRWKLRSLKSRCEQNRKYSFWDTELVKTVSLTLGLKQRHRFNSREEEGAACLGSPSGSHRHRLCTVRFLSWSRRTFVSFSRNTTSRSKSLSRSCNTWRNLNMLSFKWHTRKSFSTLKMVQFAPCSQRRALYAT